MKKKLAGLTAGVVLFLAALWGAAEAGVIERTYLPIIVDVQDGGRPTATPTRTPKPTATVKPTKTPKPTATATRVGNCHPSYPTVCIPPPPPDLNCDDIPYRNFTVLPPDPHNFDGNSDGIGCEED